MKIGKKAFAFTEAALSALVIIVIVMMLNENKAREMPKISVIVQNSEDEQWTAFRYGLKMAAADSGCELFVVGTGEDMTAEEQFRIAQSEIDSGADALIIQPALGEEAAEEMRRLEMSAPIVYIGEKYEASGERSVGFDMGVRLAEEMIRDYDGNLTGKTIGILTGENDFAGLGGRADVFRKTIEEAGGSIIWDICVNEGGEKAPEKQSKADIVAALDDDSLTKAGSASAKRELHGAVVYGIGRSAEALYYLDTGAAQCVIVRDEFDAGYRSLTDAAQRVGGSIAAGGTRHGGEGKADAYTALRRENLFSAENQEIIFAMSQ